MGAANEQIRVSGRVKRELERLKREGESYNDVLERVLDEQETGNFTDGFGRWSDEKSENVREMREQAKKERKRRIAEHSEKIV